VDPNERNRNDERPLGDERRREEVSRLVAGLAHGFNNLLTVIQGNADLLLGYLEDGDPAHEEVHEILDAAERATRLTRSLLAFGRSESLRLERIDLNEALHRLQPGIQAALGDGVALELCLPPGPLWVHADRSFARQALFELVKNARDALPEGGTFRIEGDRVRVDPDEEEGVWGLPPGDWVVVSYSDSGEGMAPKVLDRSVDAFFSTKEGRSGLGLSTVDGLLAQSGGVLRIESSPGEGTTVRTCLPDASTGIGARTNEPGPNETPSGS